MMNYFFPNEGEDPAEVGIGQGQATETTDTQTAAASDIPMMPMKSVMQIEGAGGNKYDIKVHGTERREFDTDFRSTFSNRLTGAPEIDVPDSDPRYELQQSLLMGYNDAVKNNYKDGKFSYMLNKYIDNQFKKQGIQGYPTGFPETKQETITQSDQQITDTKATVGDGAKFDAPDVSKIGAKEDLGINLQSIRKMEGGGAGSPATVITGNKPFLRACLKITTFSFTPFALAVLTKSELRAVIIDPLTTCTKSPNGLITKMPIGIIQYGTPPIPDVGNHPRETENIKIAVIATQKSGALAAVKDTTLEILSKIPFGLYAASDPIIIAPSRAIDIATAAKDKVTGIASKTMSIAGLSFLRE